MPDILWSVAQWKAANPDDEKGIADTLAAVYAAKTIYQRFDSLMDLINQCDLDKESKSAKILRDQALTFAMAIVDAKNVDDLFKKAADRKSHRDKDPHYMPWYVPAVLSQEIAQTNPTLTPKERVKKKMKSAKRIRAVNPDDVEEDKRPHYRLFDETQRERYRIFPANGKLKKIVLDEKNQNLSLQDFDTTAYSAHNEKNKAIFVMSIRGDLFAGPTIQTFLHHSSFLAGDYVSFAGTMTTAKGVLNYIDDFSGHYKPRPINLIQALALFRKAGLLDTSPKFGMFNRETSKRIVRSVKDLDFLSPETKAKRQENFVAELKSLADKDQDPVRARVLEHYRELCNQKFNLKLEKSLPAFKEVDQVIKKMLKLVSRAAEGTYSKEFIETIRTFAENIYKKTIEIGDVSFFTDQFYDAIGTNKPLAMLLIEAGINVNSSVSDGFNSSTPLLIAQYAEDQDLTKKLIEAKADLNQTFRSGNRDEVVLTFVFDQCMNSDSHVEKYEMIKLLLEAGANPLVKSCMDEDKLLSQIAKVHEKPELAQLLEKYEAIANKKLTEGTQSEQTTTQQESDEQRRTSTKRV